LEKRNLVVDENPLKSCSAIIFKEQDQWHCQVSSNVPLEEKVLSLSFILGEYDLHKDLRDVFVYPPAFGFDMTVYPAIDYATCFLIPVEELFYALTNQDNLETIAKELGLPPFWLKVMANYSFKVKEALFCKTWKSQAGGIKKKRGRRKKEPSLDQ